MQHVIPHVSSFLLSSPMKIAHVDPYVPNVSVKKQQNKTKNDCGWLRKTKYQLVTMGNYETVYIMAGWWFFALPL